MPWGSRVCSRFELGPRRVGDLHLVRVRVRHDAQPDRVLTVQALQVELLLVALDDVRHVANGDRARRPVLGDDHVADVVQVLEEALRNDVDDLGAGRHRAGGHAHVVVDERGLDLVDGQPVGGQLAVVDLDLDLLVQATRDVDLADARHRLQVGLDLVAGDVVEGVERGAGEGDVQDRRGVRVELADDRRAGFGRQLTDDRPHLLLDVDVGLVRVIAVGELHDDRALTLARARRDRVDARDAGDRVLERLGNQALDVLGRGVRPGDRDRDDADGDRRQTVDLEVGVGDPTHEHQRQDAHEHRQRTADGERRQAHSGSALPCSALADSGVIAGHHPPRAAPVGRFDREKGVQSGRSGIEWMAARILTPDQQESDHRSFAPVTVDEADEARSLLRTLGDFSLAGGAEGTHRPLRACSSPQYCGADARQGQKHSKCGDRVSG